MEKYSEWRISKVVTCQLMEEFRFEGILADDGTAYLYLDNDLIDIFEGLTTEEAFMEFVGKYRESIVLPGGLSQLSLC